MRLESTLSFAVYAIPAFLLTKYRVPEKCYKIKLDLTLAECLLLT